MAYKPTFFFWKTTKTTTEDAMPCQGVEEGVSYAMCVKYLPGNKPGDPGSQSSNDNGRSVVLSNPLRMGQ